MGSAKKLLVIGLDGFEISLADRLMASGRMPNLATLREKSARFRLDHGLAKYTGFAWEHFSTGLTPEALNRHSAVSFDPNAYHVRQNPTRHAPIFAHLKSNCVLFDVPYCDLRLEPRLMGVARWGAHDPGAPASCNPPTLIEEMTTRLGPYPATDYIYAMVWQSADFTRKAGEALANAVRVRARAAEWMLKERLPNWDLGVVVVGETHSATEPLWHGVSPSHPLHNVPSAPAARQGLEAVYLETDALIGRLADGFPEASVMVFAMHGMGDNDADVPCMVLLPEILYRRQFGRPYMRDLPWRSALPNGMPLLMEDESWHFAGGSHSAPLVRRCSIIPCWPERSRRNTHRARRDDWLPACRYRPFWPDMEAFALPSFYDGRVRTNLRGRERYGVVSPMRNQKLVSEIKSLLEECVDPITGAPVVDGFREPSRQPLDRTRTEADLYVFWRGCPTGMQHPRYGKVGPIPYRRTGGHSGSCGFLFCVGGGLPPGDYCDTSSFNVVPTVLSILREENSVQTSGQSLVSPFGAKDNRGGAAFSGDL